VQKVRGSGDTIPQQFHGPLVCAFGDNEVGVAFGGADELFVHGFDRREVLVDDAGEFAAAFLDVAPDASEDAHFRDVLRDPLGDGGLAGAGAAGIPISMREASVGPLKRPSWSGERRV
jgi:hypothetical protein